MCVCGSRWQALRENQPSWNVAELLGSHQQDGHIWRNACFPVEWNSVCAYGRCWSLPHRRCYKWAWHTGAAGTSMGQLGNLESCVARFVGPAVLAEVGKLSCVGRVCACAPIHTYVTSAAHVRTCFYRDGSIRGSLSQILERDRENKQAWNWNDTSLKYWSVATAEEASTCRHKDGWMKQSSTDIRE